MALFNFVPNNRAILRFTRETKLSLNEQYNKKYIYGKYILKRQNRDGDVPIHTGKIKESKEENKNQKREVKCSIIV